MMSALRTLLPRNVPFQQDEEENVSFGNLMSKYQDAEDDLQQILKEEQNNLVVEDSIKDEISLTAPEIHRLTHEVINSDEFSQIFPSADLKVIEKLGDDTDDLKHFLDTLGVTCEECITYEKVDTMSQIKPGDHIRIQRKYIGINWYNHHAIVTDIAQLDGEVTLVHFQKKMKGITVIKESQDFNTLKNVDIVRYRTRPFTAEQVIERAEKMAEKFAKNQHAEAYSVPSDNCEHKSNEIAVGVKFSKQIDAKATYVKSTITWLFKFLLKGAIRFCEKVKPFIRGFAHLAVVASLLAQVDHIVSLRYKMQQGFLCLKCYNDEYNKVIPSLIFCLISVGISATSHVCLVYGGVCCAIALALPYVSSFVIDTVMPIIQPASRIPKPPVQRRSMIREGEIITFPYIGLDHEGVITEISPTAPDQTDVIKVTLVHFNYPGLFGTRTVVKEVFYFSLKDQNIYVYDFSGEDPYPLEEVVKRAKDKIGAQNFSPFSNRSSHLSRYCKTGKTTVKEDLPFKKVSDLTDVKPGDVINFKYCWLSHDAVVVQVQYAESIECKVVHYNFDGLLKTRTIVEESFTFKLSDQNVFLHDYTGYDVYPPDEVVSRARSRLGEQKFNTFTNRSSHLAKWCKIKSHRDD